MVDVMNAIAQVSAAPLTGPKLDSRRVLAGVVDLLIVAAGAVLVLFAGDAISGDRQGALTAVILGWALYYYFALESGAGQTVGKKLMKLRVVRADGSAAGMREIAVRTILRVVDGIGFYVVGLIVMVVTGQRRQRIGDLAAATIVVDASGPATVVAPPAVPEAAGEPEAASEAETVEEDQAAVDAEEPEAVAEPTRTITLPSRPEPPATLSDLTDEPAADDAPVAAEPAEDAEPATVEEPVAQSEPVPVAEPVVEDDVSDSAPDAETEPFEVEPFEVKPFHVEPMELESVVPVADDEVAEEPVAEEPVAEEPVAHNGIPPAVSPSIQSLAADVAAAQESRSDEPDADSAQADVDEQDETAEDDGPVNVKSVETVSAMDLIMGAAEEDAAQSDEDEGPVSA